MNPVVTKVHGKERRWGAEYAALRQLCLESGLNEELKWGQACYDLDGGKVVLIHGFKEYCALLFFKGALMKDAKGILIQQTANVQAARINVGFTRITSPVDGKTGAIFIQPGNVIPAVSARLSSERYAVHLTVMSGVAGELTQALHPVRLGPCCHHILAFRRVACWGNNALVGCAKIETATTVAAKVVSALPVAAPCPQA